MCAGAVAILPVQTVCSMLWLRLFAMGRFDYLWRLGTYGSKSAEASYDRDRSEKTA
ncbi:hypothetical protein B9G55_21595 [Saccharibacillus sp. O16]|nr:hypothetical protein B9G55_21595 [Saccharibacillus sp. O16]